MDIKQVSVSEQFLREIGEDHGEIHHGTYHYEDPDKPGKVKEEIRYWWKDPVYEFVQSVVGLVNGYDLRSEEIDFFNVVFGGDYGQGKFRFAAKVVLRRKSGKYYDDAFGLADVSGINKIWDSDIVFEGGDTEASPDFEIDLIDSSSQEAHKHRIHPNTYVAGDLVFLAIMMGKESFTSAWCNWCKLSKAEWQDSDCNPELWELKTIIEQAHINEENKYKDERRRGPWKIIFFSGLHALIGIINDVLESLATFVDVQVEQITNEELQLRRDKVATEIRIRWLRQDKEVWMKSKDGGRLLEKNRRRLKRLKLELKDKDISSEIKVPLLKENEEVEADERKLVAERSILSTRITAMEKEVTKAKEKLETYTRERKGEEESLYTQVDRLYHNYDHNIGATRAQYHGGKFNGIDLRKIMTNADYLFGRNGQVRSLIATKAPDGDTIQSTHKICDDVCLALKLWDGIFADMYKVYPTPVFCDILQGKINKAMAHHRAMGLSVTPKAHGCDTYQEALLSSSKTGSNTIIRLGDATTSATVERLDKQASIRSRMEKRARHPRVQMNKKLVEERYKGIRRAKKSALKREIAEVKVKREMRDGAFSEAKVKLEEMDLMS
ncbi:LOW QUALITY PROTEIN: hypothetical protein ACHAWF_010401 [Thalassiosira exigua]